MALCRGTTGKSGGDADAVREEASRHPVHLVLVLELPTTAVAPDVHVKQVAAPVITKLFCVLLDDDVHDVLNAGAGVVQVLRQENV